MSDRKPTLHHLNDSQSQSILWLLEELGIDYDLVPYRRKKGRSPPELKEVHPRGKSPVLVTRSGRVLTERSAIALYLIRTYDAPGRFQVASPVLPSSSSSDDAASENSHGGDNDDLVREEELVSLGTASMNPAIMFAFILGMLVKHAPFFLWPVMAGFNLMLRKAFLDGELDNGFAELERALLKPKTTGAIAPGSTARQHAREYLMGGPEPTRADFVVEWFVEWAAAGRLVDMEKYPAVERWYERCRQRPAYRRALDKGNGYDLVNGTSW
ncbi:glutathione S-transferase [Apiospora rasikravindrae]|uniref:Glutathione S-transferase n=1 Tax=Apiospora rasikravindrae TaxID=990691 RepID=A0ABR1SJ39_9PEZI